MDASDRTDTELLADWLTNRRESAFRALVGRYARLVHMAARRICGSEDLAADASQLVFIRLAQKAGSLASHTSLGGWLHVATVMESRNQLRKHQHEIRKRELLRSAMEPTTHSAETWREIQPVLDGALAALSAKDREALLLRFYRSLTVREVAATLGTTTAAAQKRIDRATARLREKLAKRGCPTAGTLAAALATGFAADAHVAVPGLAVTISRALAASSIAPIFMKTTSLALAAVALVAAGVWLAMARQPDFPRTSGTTTPQNRPASASADNREPAVLPRRPARDRSRPRPETGAIDWPGFVAGFPEMRRRNDRSVADRIERRLKSMTMDELVAEQERIDALVLPDMYRSLIQEMVMQPMFAKAPEMALSRFVEHPNEDTDTWFDPLESLKRWAAEDPEKATAWLDAQVAAGKLADKSPDGSDSLRIRFESALIGVLLPADAVAAGRHLATVPPAQRAAVLNGLRVGGDNRVAFAEMVRTGLPEADQAGAISEQASQIAEDGNYAELAGYLEEIGATAGERAATVARIPVDVFQQLARSRGITKEDVDALREWISANDAGPPDVAIGKALARAPDGGGRRQSYEALGELALGTGKDEVLTAFLMEPMTYLLHPKSARAFAAKIVDEDLRRQVLDTFVDYPKPR